MQCAAWLKDRREEPKGHEERNRRKDAKNRRERTEMVRKGLEGE